MQPPPKSPPELLPEAPPESLLDPRASLASRACASHGSEWQAVEDVCRILQSAGYQALLAGGCVRDFLIHRSPHDFDIATDATPDQVEALFPKALGVGRAFGVMVLPYKDFQLEVATFRIDLAYKDGRRPEGVQFATAEEDAKRRDFTINALFYDLLADRVIDYVGGQADLELRLIRTVGVATDRFAEDKLRLLRGVRFAAQLGFVLDPKTLQAITDLAPAVTNVSRERVREEILKLLRTERPRAGLELMVQTGLLSALFPELKVDPDQWISTFSNFGDVSAGFLLALFFAPLRDSKKALAELKTLKCSRAEIDEAAFIWRTLDSWQSPRGKRRGEMILQAHEPAAKAARLYASLQLGHELVDAAYLDELALIEVSVPWITGDDAQALGFKPGRALGEALREVYLLQLEEAFSDREAAVAWMKARA